MITPELREYAETPDRFTNVVPGSSIARRDDGRVCVLLGATWASVSGPNVSEDEVADLVAYTRELVGRERDAMWWLGPSARPPDIRERLLALGLTEPRDRVSRLIAVALTEEPRGAAPEIEVHRIETFDDLVAAREIQWEAFDVPAERREAQRRRLRTELEEMHATGLPVGFVAVLGGRPAATATSLPSSRGVFLIAAATAPWARGRGLYRALVRARWDDAVERGTPALVTQANPGTSYPILKRLGFEDVCEITRAEDVAQSSGSTTPAT